MKILTREFTLREKILLLILTLIIMILCYYRFFYIPIQDQILADNSQTEELQAELTIQQAKLAELQSMQEELDTLEAEGNLSYMASYNNAKAELQFLNGILSPTNEYYVAVADVTRDGDQIRRNISVQFKVDTYEEAERFIQALETSENRCLVSDVSVSRNTDGTYSASATSTFFETMQGGVSDAGLPENSDK